MRHSIPVVGILILAIIVGFAPAMGADAKPAGGQAGTKTDAKKDKAAAKPAAEKDKNKTEASKKEPAKPATSEKAADAQKEKAAKAPEKEKAAKGAASPSKTASPTAKKKAAREPKKATVVRFHLWGTYPERQPGMGLFSDIQPSLSTLVKRIDEAAEDSDVAAVILKIDNLAIGWGKIYELRGAIARFRAKNKPVYAELASADASQYLIATACDEVVMPRSGVLLLPGVRAEMMFYKGLFDKLGIQFDILQQGKFKGAGEPFTRTNMSPPLRESIDAVVNSIYEELAATVAKDRKLADYQVKTLIDQGIFTATAAQKARLVDQLLYGDELETALRKRLKVDALKLVTNYKKKQVDTDFSGFSGLMKLMELMFGGGKKKEAVTAQKKIAVVYAVGPIVEGKTEADLFGEEMVESASLVKALRTAAEDDKVAAIVLRIDSPGGSAVASDLIWREVVRLKKPVIASMSDVAGSGGYYIAMGAKSIVAAPGTITGSIGVIGGKVVLKGLLSKVGLNVEVVSRGSNSGSFSMSEPFSPSERAAWTTLLEETYRQFVSKAAQGRKMPREKLEKLAEGRIYTGRMAVTNGLVDRVGTLQDAIDEAKKAAHLKSDEKVEILVLPKPKNFFEQLFGDNSVAADLDAVMPGLRATVKQVAGLRRLFAEPSLFLMPYRIEIK